MDYKNNHLAKKERLKSRSSIIELFTNGSSHFVHPIKLKYSIGSSDHTESTLKVAFSVPKRLHKKAHVRNLLKRRMREAYRKNKPQIQSGRSCHLMFILIDKDVSDYNTLERSIIKLNSKISDELSNYDS